MPDLEPGVFVLQRAFLRLDFVGVGVARELADFAETFAYRRAPQFELLRFGHVVRFRGRELARTVTHFPIGNQRLSAHTIDSERRAGSLPVRAGDFGHQRTPRLTFRVGAGVLGSRLRDMATPASGREPRDRVGVLVRVAPQRDDVIAFEPRPVARNRRSGTRRGRTPGPALATTAAGRAPGVAGSCDEVVEHWRRPVYQRLGEPGGNHGCAQHVNPPA